MPEIIVTVPEFITVHLGAPSSNAQNVTISFADYIKNVASSEIYPTWPENAIRANIYAQITFALNRVFTEFYRSKGYDFDITNSTSFDQFFVPNRNIFDSVSEIVNEIFNTFIQRQGTIGPIFAAYCNGTTVTCRGLSQWGSVTLANQGYYPYRILTTYYGNDIDLVRNVRVRPNVPSYDGTPSRLGDNSPEVRAIQSRLNTVANNYPSIPRLVPDGIFGERTERSVKEFQRIFGLDIDGIVGKETWYKLINITNAVKRLNELDSEGLTIEEYSQQFFFSLVPGDTGESVEVLQYYLSIIGSYYDEIPQTQITGVYDEQTANAVYAFQLAFSLDPDRIVNERDWNEIQNVYFGILPYFKDATDQYKVYDGRFPGFTLKMNSEG
ncbi:MAG: peptidoglycan-binding protein [Clostridia bacterium]|nr:peptidoglycan-binding protein [Clostridia bacterium]